METLLWLFVLLFVSLLVTFLVLIFEKIENPTLTSTNTSGRDNLDTEQQQTDSAVKVNWDSSQTKYASSSSNTTSSNTTQTSSSNQSEKLGGNNGHIDLFLETVELAKSNSFSFQKTKKYQTLIHLIEYGRGAEDAAINSVQEINISLPLAIDRWNFNLDLFIRYQRYLMENELPFYLQKIYLEHVQVHLAIIQTITKTSNPLNLDDLAKEKMINTLSMMFSACLGFVKLPDR